ncbi:hypothetical protein [Microbacterium sp. NPDC080220]|uniref:hypothetical protein n=1 Tax=Microbacterium sp. NPDC080220 TaxID=3161017 RepID=UPI0034347F14
MSEATWSEFGGAWLKDQIVDGRLERRVFTSDPRQDNNARLDQIIEFSGPTDESSSRTGWADGEGNIDWGTWES